jgi:hypothetical protein
MKSRYQTNHEEEAAYYGEMVVTTIRVGQDLAGISASDRAGMLAQEAAHEAFLAHPELREPSE